MSARARKWPYVIAALILIPTAFSYFYLELASILGLATALALGLGWTALVGMGYRHRARVRAFPVRMLALFFGAWVLLAGVHVHQQVETRLSESEVPINPQVMSQQRWRSGGWQSLPDRRSLLGPEIAQSIDFQLAAPLVDARGGNGDGKKGLLAQLEAQGWVSVPPISWRGVMMGLNHSPLHWPRALNGRSEAILMARSQKATGQVEVLRLWDSGLLLETDEASPLIPVWLGQARVVQLERGLLGFRRWRDRPDPSPVEALQEQFGDEVLIRVR